MRYRSLRFGTRTLALQFILLFLVAARGSAQLNPASPPVADPADARFKGVTEDWASPSLSGTHLIPAQPLVAPFDDNDKYEVQLIQLQWRWGDPIDLYVTKPKGVKKPPVILYLYGYPADTDRFKSPMWQEAATKGGFAAVGFVSALTGHRYHDRPMKEWFLSELQECLADSAHDVQMILNYLESRGDLDMTRVGMFGHGSGATIAILASAADPRIRVVDTIDPWGDWPIWMAKSPFVPEDERADLTKPEFLKKAAVLEPIDWLPKSQATKFRMQDATFDKITPKESKEKLRAAVPKDAAVVIYKTPAEFNEMVRNKTELDWIKLQVRFVPPLATTQTATSTKPQ